MALPILVSCQGCGLPWTSSRRLIVGYQSVNAAQTSRKTVVPGIDVRYKTGHDGLNLGWSSIAIAQPAPPSAPASSQTNENSHAASYLPPLAIAWSRDGTRHSLGWQWVPTPPPQPHTPRFILATEAGLSLPINPHHTGLNLSLQRQTWLLMPPNAETGTWHVHLEPGQLPSLQTKTSPDKTTKPSP